MAENTAARRAALWVGLVFVLGAAGNDTSLTMPPILGAAPPAELRAPRLLMSSNMGRSASLSIGPTAPIEANVGALIRISNTRVRQTVLRSRNKSKLAGRLGKLE